MAAPASLEAEAGVHSAAASKHETRRLDTRAGILNAARGLIAEGRFYGCSVDQLAQTAGVSRSAFYLNFPNKQAVLDALQEDMAAWYLRQYRKLDPSVSRSEEAVVNWLRNFIRGFSAAKGPISMLTLREEGLLQIGTRVRGEAILVMGAQIPQFQLVGEDGLIDNERRLEMLMLVFLIEKVCAYLTMDSAEEPELALRILARQFLGILNRTR